eukprot:TRINITY_DN30032_c0_g1_i1.p1 TRINITY_DN30032_c0_g1~~TRINITY_DN30032_c0_g1_i1.p1  ORF type:complete len:615 (+),score=104.63 TRINITY_DN30032_c0_g1_i1:1207-3051(+)
MMNNNGRGASLAAPHGPSEQEAIVEAIRNAGILPADVDAVEVHGSGAFLSDAIEVSSMARAHRSEDQRDPPLLLSAVKTSMGNQVETAGITNFLKTIYSTQVGVMTPNLHLRQANPHTDLADQPVSIVTENMEYKMSSAFVGVASRGFGGSNVYIVTWGNGDYNRVPDNTVQTISQRDQIMYWPGGGGALEPDSHPSNCYCVCGSWSQWRDPVPMEAEGNGVFSSVVTLGENRWEQFQIWLDGDPSRSLHPGDTKSYKGSLVYGPDNLGTGYNWHIDGRCEVPVASHPELQDALLPASLKKDARSGDLETSKLPSADFGLPGDQYRVELRVVGKFRNVTWERIPTSRSQSSPTSQTYAETFGGSVRGRYYITGLWNDWTLQEMEADRSRPGVFQTDALLWRGGAEFQIVRNRDWSQVLHPAKPRTSQQELGEVLGPDDQGHGLNWILGGEAGDTFRIELTRTAEEGKDSCSVNWEKLSKTVLSPSEMEKALRRSYSIVGSWSSWQTPEEMAWDGNSYVFVTQLGSRGEESFQILLDGLWERVLHPDRADASPDVSHSLRGPSIDAHGLNWTIGRQRGSTQGSGRAGETYQVRLVLDAFGDPRKVEWSKIDPSSK